MDAATQQTISENPVIKIMFEHFMVQYNDEEKAIAAINFIAEQVKQPGCKLIHLGNIVFLITVSTSHMVEMHAMMGGNLTEDQKIAELDKQLDKLLPILKKMEVKLAYTYMTVDKVNKFRKVLQEYKFYEQPVRVEDKNYMAFYVEV